jgi:REP element-mobilizing transposase RayT
MTLGPPACSRLKKSTCTSLSQSERAWHNRGYLPHLDRGGICQSITLRLFDSLPQSLLRKLYDEVLTLPPDRQSIVKMKKIETWIDSGYGACYLRDARIAAVVESSLFYYHGKQYYLHAWVIMPNHIHFLATLFPRTSLSSTIRCLKSFSALQSNKILQRSGTFWFRDYFDRFIRHQNHFLSVLAYIENNPVKAGLCKCSTDWLFGSAIRRLKEAS